MTTTPGKKMIYEHVKAQGPLDKWTTSYYSWTKILPYTNLSRPNVTWNETLAVLSLEFFTCTS